MNYEDVSSLKKSGLRRIYWMNPTSDLEVLGCIVTSNPSPKYVHCHSLVENTERVLQIVEISVGLRLKRIRVNNSSLTKKLSLRKDIWDLSEQDWNVCCPLPFRYSLGGGTLIGAQNCNKNRNMQSVITENYVILIFAMTKNPPVAYSNSLRHCIFYVLYTSKTTCHCFRLRGWEGGEDQELAPEYGWQTTILSQRLTGPQMTWNELIQLCRTRLRAWSAPINWWQWALVVTDYHWPFHPGIEGTTTSITVS